MAERFTKIIGGDRSMLGELVEIGFDISWSWLVFFGMLDDVDISFPITF
jgi:hypothetical protein